LRHDGEEREKAQRRRIRVEVVSECMREDDDENMQEARTMREVEQKMNSKDEVDESMTNMYWIEMYLCV
jgi:hypothetical protein